MRYQSVAHPFIGIFLAISLHVTSVWAAPKSYTHIVELFTSQGCSSCPPADALAGELVKSRSDVVVLSWHVDYWDYIGWKDSFADPEFTARQKAYAKIQQAESVYTPQFMINGRHVVAGYQPKGVAQGLSLDGLSVQVASSAGDTILQPIGQNPSSYDVIRVWYSPEETVLIGRGENSGRRLSYYNSVRRVDTLGRWDGRRSFAIEAAKEVAGLKSVVLVQHTKTMQIIGAME